MNKLKLLFNSRKKTLGLEHDVIAYFSKEFNITPKKMELYAQALTHKSKSPDQNNERLEYLGDTVLSSVVVSYLYDKFPKKNEGELTVLTSKIVSRKNLNEIGEKIGLSDYIIAVDYDNGYKNILGNTFEAIIGAIYLDKGFEITQNAVQYALLDKLDLAKMDEEETNFKSVLIVWGQKTGNKVLFKGKRLPESSKYKSTLFINSKKINTIAKDSKKEAEQYIAEKALSSLILKD